MSRASFPNRSFAPALAAFHRVIAQREARLLEALAAPQSLARLVARRLIYGKVKEPRFVYDHMEGQMVAKHLDRLLGQGLITRTPAGFRAAALNKRLRLPGVWSPPGVF